MNLVERVCGHIWMILRHKYWVFQSVVRAHGGIDGMINPDCKDKEALARVNYMADKLETLLENQQVIKTPVVRNGKESNVGYEPEIWKSWQAAKG